MSKTKEEIIWEHTANGEYPSYYHESDIQQMMDEYAKQQASGFAEWTIGWEQNVVRNRERLWISKLPSVYGDVPRTTDELYALFLQSPSQ